MVAGGATTVTTPAARWVTKWPGAGTRAPSELSISFQTSRSILVLVCWLELPPSSPPPLPPDPLLLELPPPLAELDCAGLGVAPETSDVICLTEGSARTSKTRVTRRAIVIRPSS